VQVLLRLADGQVLTIPRTADAAGTFRLGAEDVPPRATWAWTDVVAVRVVLPTPAGHQMIAQTEDFEAPAGPTRRPVYLPIAYAKGRGAAVAAVGVPADSGPGTGVVATAPRSAARARVLNAAPALRRAFGWLGPWGEMMHGNDLIQPPGAWRHGSVTGDGDGRAAHGRPTPLRIP
jgi:hypothetical protein